jgi:hypothetical protein
MPEEIHARRADAVRSLRARLASHRTADLAFERHVPARTTCHRDREARRRSERDAARTVGESQPGNPEPADRATELGRSPVAFASVANVAAPERRVAVEQPQQLVARQLREQRARVGLGRFTTADGGHGTSEGSHAGDGGPRTLRFRVGALDPYFVVPAVAANLTRDC